MAKADRIETANTDKYGPRNVLVLMEGDDLVIRVDTKRIIGSKGDLKNPDRADDDAYANDPKNTRKKNLVATSGGFMGSPDGRVDISLNVVC
jgi:hypothetical protein